MGSDGHPFDVDEFLARPLLARVATNGPTVRPVWHLWDDGAFWWLTGTCSALLARLADDPRVALVVDSCEVEVPEVRQVIAYGTVQRRDYDPDRAYRKIAHYLRPDVTEWGPPWDPQDSSEDVTFLRLGPDRMVVRDLSRPLPDWSQPDPADR